MTQFTKRKLVPERMDQPDADRAELASSLKFIRRVNARLGGTEIWLGLALYYFAEYAYGRCRLPDWMASWLQWRFGPLTCPAPGN